MRARPLLFFASLTALAACQSTTVPPPPATHFRGVAYTFNTPLPIPGATVSVAELPQFTTVTDENGYYDLAVEVTVANQKVTPFIVKATFHTIYLQTWTLQPGDADQTNVHFQTPDEGTFVLLSTLVGVGSKTTKCQVVTTVSDKVIQGMTYEQFRDHGAHGVAGVVASATPTLPKPIYFNAKVVPDVSLTETTDDGGVLWTDVPNGEYTLSAVHPTRQFTTIQITCTDNRIINANPPWGLHELP